MSRPRIWRRQHERQLARGVDVATIPRRMVQGVAWSASGERVLIHNLTPGGGRAGGPAGRAWG